MKSNINIAGGRDVLCTRLSPITSPNINQNIADAVSKLIAYENCSRHHLTQREGVRRSGRVAGRETRAWV